MKKKQMIRYADAIERTLDAAARGKTIEPCPVCRVSETPDECCKGCPISKPYIGDDGCWSLGYAIRASHHDRRSLILRGRSLIRKLRAGTWKP